jgi:hypothetical protein
MYNTRKHSVTYIYNRGGGGGGGGGGSTKASK